MTRLATRCLAVAMTVGLGACGGSGNTVTGPDATSTSPAPSVTAAGGGVGRFSTSARDPRGTTAADASVSDRSFVAFAAKVSQAEIELGTMAEQRGDRPEVKEFGRQMVQDHTNALAALRDIAPELVPQTPNFTASEEQLRVQAAQQSGSAFDRIYAPAMIEAHEAAITRFQQQGLQSDAPAIREYAESMLPSLEAHLNMARDLASFVP
jgi:putative membrane protein